MYTRFLAVNRLSTTNSLTPRCAITNFSLLVESDEASAEVVSEDLFVFKTDDGLDTMATYTQGTCEYQASAG